MPMHTERDIAISNPSVCPSVSHTLVLYRKEYIHIVKLSAIR